MPINFTQLHAQISAAGSAIQADLGASAQFMQRLNNQFRSLQNQPDLMEKIRDRLALAPQVRCGIPRSDENPCAVFPLPNNPTDHVTVIASDGSQITPSRHDEISFGLINVSVFEMQLNSGTPPRIHTETTLFEKLPAKQSEDLSSEDQIGHMRDVAEREMLAKEASAIQNGNPVIALIDGPLEPYFLQKSTDDRKEEITEYARFYQPMMESGVIPAGYIDRPRSDLVIRLIELLDETLPISQLKKPRPVAASDSGLFGGLLPPENRSAIFKLRSPAALSLPADYQLSFFYLNVGTDRHPSINRVEIPEWVARCPESVNLLHEILIRQCRILPASPYPYALHRAHESAVVQFAEKDRIKKLLMQELLSREIVIQNKSAKQTAKDRSGLKFL